MKQLQSIAIAITGLMASTAALAGSTVPGGPGNDLPVPGALALIAIGAGALYLFRRK